MAARTYKRDSNGRFASGGGGSSGGGKSAAKKTAAKKPAAKPAAKKTATSKSAASKPAAKKTAAKKPAAKPAAAKPATDSRRGPRGGKAGTRAEQRKAAAAQAARSASFRGKATAGRSAKAAFKAAQGAARKASGRKLTGMGRAPATKLPSANSDAYKYNKAGLLASPQERSRMRGRDRAREKNAALAQQQAVGMRRAERRAARKLTSDRTDPGSVLRHSSTYNAAERAIKRRTSRASANFSAGSALERQKNSLIQKALKMQQKASDRKGQGKSVTKTAEANFQQVLRQIKKIDRSLATRRRAMDVIGAQSRRMEINTKNRYRY